jgi:putative peptidoglycan lipid II flippase
MLAIWLARRDHYRLSATEWRRHILILVISAAMAGILYGLYWPLQTIFAPGRSVLLQLVALFALIGFGITAYFAAIHYSGVQPMGMLLKRLRRGG